MGTLEAQNRQVVERYWEAHFLRDWEAMAGFFAPDAHYTDVGVDGQGARGPQQIVDRLKIGIEPLSGYYHHPRHIVAEGDLVILEHVEEWQFHTGERIMHPFVRFTPAGPRGYQHEYWEWDNDAGTPGPGVILEPVAARVLRRQKRRR